MLCALSKVINDLKFSHVPNWFGNNLYEMNLHVSYGHTLFILNYFISVYILTLALEETLLFHCTLQCLGNDFHLDKVKSGWVDTTAPGHNTVYIALRKWRLFQMIEATYCFLILTHQTAMIDYLINYKAYHVIKAIMQSFF